MYAASGLLTYGASEDMDHIIATLQAAGLCSEVLYKELYIPQAELDGVPSCSAGSVSLFVYVSCDLLLDVLRTRHLFGLQHQQRAHLNIRPLHVWAACPDAVMCPAALNSEQKALLDFLVLAKGKLFVGFGSSTFSFYLVSTPPFGLLLGCAGSLSHCANCVGWHLVLCTYSEL